MTPLARALRFVEKLIARRVTTLHARASDPEMSKRAAHGLRQRADELSLLIADIRAARLADGDA